MIAHKAHGLRDAADKYACPMVSESHVLGKVALVRSPLRVEFERTGYTLSYSPQS